MPPQSWILAVTLFSLTDRILIQGSTRTATSTSKATQQVVSTTSKQQTASTTTLQQTVTGLRLVGGNSTYGRLQIQIVNDWATVCDDWWTDVNSRIACRELGFTGGITWSNINNTLVGSEAPIGLDDVICNESNTRISECSHRPFYQHNCGHREDVFLSCFYGFTPFQPSLSFFVTPELRTITSLRLVGGNSTYGRLQVQIGNNWVTVCSDLWSDLNSRIVCRQLGFVGGITTSNLYNTLTGSDVPIGLDDVVCNTWNIRINECSHMPFYLHNCDHQKDVFLSCSYGITTFPFTPTFPTMIRPQGFTIFQPTPRITPFPFITMSLRNSLPPGITPFPPIKNFLTTAGPQRITNLRLVGGNSTYGRLQVQINNNWATVCDDFWRAANSIIACKELGFNGGFASSNINHTLVGSDVPIGLDDVVCDEWNTRLSECSHRPFYQHNCAHSEDIFLSCF